MATPVRNVRIADPMWSELGKLAHKRKTTITALLVEGAEYILNAGGYSKPDPPSQEETLTRLATLQQEFEALALRVKELEGQLRGQLATEVPTLNVLSVPPTDETLTQAVSALTQRLDRIETTIAPLTHALERVPQVVKDEGVDVEEVGSKEDTSELSDVDELGVGVETITPTPLPPTLEYPLSQRELSERLGTSTQNLSNRRGSGTPKDKANFEAWSKRHDPDGVAWTWIGRPGGKGIPMRYVPAKP